MGLSHVRLPFGYCFFKRSVFGVMDFEVVVDGSGGIFELSNIVFGGVSDVSVLLL